MSLRDVGEVEGKTYCFIGTDGLSQKEFNEKVVGKVVDIIGKKDNNIILSDGEIMLTRFLHKRGYRKVKVYHTGKKPKQNIGNYTLKGEFTTDSDVECNLRNDADEVISDF